MEYLALDIEIAFDFGRISTNLFPPEDGERVLLSTEEIIDDEDGIINEDDETEAIWIEAQYIGDIIKRFRLPDGELVTATHWKYQGSDLKRFRPLGITCAAAASSDGGLWNWWAEKPDGRFADKISKGMCQTLVANLRLLVRDAGYVLLTWNGLGFDFDVLAEESGMVNECKELALSHIDMMFHFFAGKGFPLGLDAAAEGQGLPGKPEGMTGAKAPELWAKGEYHRVLDYCSRDAKNTLALAEAVAAAGCLDWTSRAGHPNSWLCSKWLTVKEAMALPEPDTSWMDDPWPRSKFYGWTGYEPPVYSAAPPLIPWDADYDEIEEEEDREVE